MAVTLINVFSVPRGKETEFVKWWQDVKENITAQQGFISGKFHRSIKPESRYNSLMSRSHTHLRTERAYSLNRPPNFAPSTRSSG